MSPARTEVRVKVGSRELTLSNLDKVMYPEVGFTKGQVIDYYTRIAPVLLPHLKGRPLTLKRYPNGVDGPFFYEKNCPDHRPSWVKTQPVWSESNGRDIEYCLAQDLPTLVWAANLADLEMHVTMALARTPQKPTMVVFDLDPGAPADIVECCQVGLLLRDLFDDLGLTAFAKTSGSKGLQVYVPLNTPTSYEVTTPWSRRIAERLEREHPGLVVSKQKKELRVGKVLVDWSQNVDSKTTACVYSLRARSRPTCSTPVTWDEVAAGAERDLQLVFETEDVLARVDERGDLFGPLLTLKQKVKPL
ncbi:MAG TPA: non-homologous end-joining DNA ligase [Mycobacteriales bacterium]|nr:non-homologous end-joining DNA ligase [Mycobacteriales bacterium]